MQLNFLSQISLQFQFFNYKTMFFIPISKVDNESIVCNEIESLVSILFLSMIYMPIIHSV